MRISRNKQTDGEWRSTPQNNRWWQYQLIWTTADKNVTFYANGWISKFIKYEYLGIIINDNLSWSPQVEYVICQANNVLGLLGRNFEVCLQELREVAYFFVAASDAWYVRSVALVDNWESPWAVFTP